MNGDERRRMEIYHPEIVVSVEKDRRRKEFFNPNTIGLSTTEKKRRNKIVGNIYKLGKGLSFTFMVLGTVFVAYASSLFTNFWGFSIALFGIIFDVILGMLIAYNFGIKMQERYEKIIIKGE